MVRALVCLVVAAAVSTGLATAASGTANACRPTANDAVGPFGATGIDAPLRAKIGSGHVLRGRVLRAGDCAAVARALVVFWQSGPNGYGPRGRGSVRTDRQGRFRIEGPVPSNYGRGPHIHIAVVHGAYEELLTRYVVGRGASSGRITIVLTPLL